MNIKYVLHLRILGAYFFAVFLAILLSKDFGLQPAVLIFVPLGFSVTVLLVAQFLSQGKTLPEIRKNQIVIGLLVGSFALFLLSFVDAAMGVRVNNVCTHRSTIGCNWEKINKDYPPLSLSSVLKVFIFDTRASSK